MPATLDPDPRGKVKPDRSGVDGWAPGGTDDGPEHHVGAEGIALGVDELQPREHDAQHSAQDESGVDADENLAASQCPQGQAEDPRQPHVAIAEGTAEEP